MPKKENQKQQKQEMPDDNTPMPETNDAGDAISEDSLYDASGAATGGGVDIDQAIERSDANAIRQQHAVKNTRKRR